MDRLDEVASENLARLNSISDFCEAVGASHRTLARALRMIRGTTPNRYLHELRLAAARKALLGADPASESVTQVAMRLGFRELGRFAAEYRTAFGESPSETLRRSDKQPFAAQSAAGVPRLGTKTSCAGSF